MIKLCVVGRGMGRRGLDNVEPKSEFQAALLYFARKKGYGVQSWIARKIGLSQQYIHLLIFGQREGDENTRRLIADVFGYPYEKFLELGKLVMAGSDPQKFLQQTEKEKIDMINKLETKIDNIEKQLNLIMGALQGMGIRIPESPLSEGVEGNEKKA